MLTYAIIGFFCFVAGMLLVQVTRYERLRIAERQVVQARAETQQSIAEFVRSMRNADTYTRQVEDALTEARAELVILKGGGPGEAAE